MCFHNRDEISYFFFLLILKCLNLEIENFGLQFSKIYNSS